MPTNPYTTVAISGYDASSPSDDGAATAANRVEWAKHKNKHSDPLKTLAETINTNVNTAFAALKVTDETAEGENVIGNLVFS